MSGRRLVSDAFSSEGIAAARARAGQLASRFGRQDDGSLLIFGLFCFVMMLILAGVALDLMRFEERRTTLQNTVDRAALAAADLNQTLSPQDVVRDYFLKAGLTPPDPSDIVVQNGNFNDWRTVQINVHEAMPTWFMNIVGVPTLGTPASGTAEERIGQVEISLVLDVSGSMNSNSRLTNLKPAAKQFIDTMFDSVEPGKLSISIVTYSTQVSVGPNLIQYFNVTGEHSASDCIEFDTADFSKTTMDFGFNVTDRIYQRNGHFDPFYTSAPTLLNCPTEANRDIKAFSGDRDALKAHIDSLTASGNTSIDIGMKWGVALLDPSMSGVVDAMIANDEIPPEFADRPYPYPNGTVTQANLQSKKIVVIMTDGANTTEYKLKAPYRSGNSIITGNNHSSYTATDRNQYSIWDGGRGQWFNVSTNTWRAQPWGDNPGDTGDAVPLTWQEVYSRGSINWIADNIVGRAWGTTVRNQWRSSGNTVVSRVSPSTTPTKDTLTRNICDAAKAKGIVIFTVAFEAPTAGANLLAQCASNGNNLSASGTGITTAFASIASSINKLRLTN
jgi:hypothetical protein